VAGQCFASKHRFTFTLSEAPRAEWSTGSCMNAELIIEFPEPRRWPVEGDVLRLSPSTIQKTIRRKAVVR
jgi:hypothetical protein